MLQASGEDGEADRGCISVSHSLFPTDTWTPDPELIGVGLDLGTPGSTPLATLEK